MEILIDNKSCAPIYEQIYTQIRSQIQSGSLREDSTLPSIRCLAKDLRISFIATRRAYEELEKSGYIYTIPGKGCYVAERNRELIREENLKKMETLLMELGDLALIAGITRWELEDMIVLALEDKL